MKTNKNTKNLVDGRMDTENRLAGGMGLASAKQKNEALLRRAVMACLLWEDMAYENGVRGAENIKTLIAKVDPEIVFDIAVEARNIQKLRHVPLYIAAVMAGLNTHKHLVSKLLPQIIQRADELAEFVSIYWREKKHPLSAQIKKGLASSFAKFNEYHFSKYKGIKNEVSLKDVMKLVHPIPSNTSRSELYNRIKTDSLATPDTWEVSLSAGKDKKETWERLISEKKLGALAFFRNLRNMEEANVNRKIITEGIKNLNASWLLPLDYLKAAKHAPRYEQEIEDLMISMFEGLPKLKGHTVFVVDVSGSMHTAISGKSEYNRMQVAEAMAMLASFVCEKFSLYVTAGSDGMTTHKTKLLSPRRGFGLMEQIENVYGEMGGGGIFTRQALEYINEDMRGEKPERIIVFSDSEDCDRVNKVPKPFGKYNYIVDVSAHSRGIAYDGVWTAEVSGWSEHFITFIMAMEGLSVEQTGDEDN